VSDDPRGISPLKSTLNIYLVFDVQLMGIGTIRNVTASDGDEDEIKREHNPEV
jgi:hypothetical protein